MTFPPLHDGNAVAQQYLQHATALQQELLKAMEAIAHNSLADFEQSLWQQEMLSMGMKRGLHLLRTLHLSPAMLAELRSANASLQQASAAYHGLIGQASQSASLLRGVCTLYGQAPSPSPNKQQTLYCEA